MALSYSASVLVKYRGGPPRPRWSFRCVHLCDLCHCSLFCVDVEGLLSEQTRHLSISRKAPALQIPEFFVLQDPFTIQSCYHTVFLPHNPLPHNPLPHNLLPPKAHDALVSSPNSFHNVYQGGQANCLRAAKAWP